MTLPKQEEIAEQYDVNVNTVRKAVGVLEAEGLVTPVRRTGTVADVKRWNPAVLNEVATTIRQREQILIHSGDDFGKIGPVDGWSGPAADSASSSAPGVDDQGESAGRGC